MNLQQSIMLAHFYLNCLNMHNKLSLHSKLKSKIKKYTPSKQSIKRFLIWKLTWCHFGIGRCVYSGKPKIIIVLSFVF